MVACHFSLFGMGVRGVCEFLFLRKWASKGSITRQAHLLAKSANAGVVFLFSKVARWSSRLYFSNVRAKGLQLFHFWDGPGRTRNEQRRQRQAHLYAFRFFYGLEGGRIRP